MQGVCLLIPYKTLKQKNKGSIFKINFRFGQMQGDGVKRLKNTLLKTL